MIATDDDGRADLTALYQVVHCHAKLGALAEPEPADPRRQALEMDALFRQLHPACQGFVRWKKFEREPISPCDVRGIAAQSDPAKRPFPFAKKRPDVFGNEAGDIERVFAPPFFCLLRRVVSLGL